MSQVARGWRLDRTGSRRVLGTNNKMATEFHKVEIQRFPRIAKRQTADTRYWKKFSVSNVDSLLFRLRFLTYKLNMQFPIVVKEFGAVSHVDFCAKETHDFAVTSGSRVSLTVQKLFFRSRLRWYLGNRV